MINRFDYEGIKFPVSKKGYCRIEGENNICINVSVMKIIWLILFKYQIKSLNAIPLKIVWIYC